MFRARYADVYKGDERWREIEVTGGDTYGWPAGIDLHRQPALFRGHDDDADAADRHHRRAAAGDFGEFITTDHIRPAGAIKLDSPAGKYLIEHQVGPRRLQQLRRPPRQP